VSPSRIGRRRRERIAARAGHRCSYCRSSQQITGSEGQIDHVTPEARGGSDDDDNLCWCCDECNTFKGDAIEALDPDTDHRAPLFHPVRERWGDHFAWAEGGALIVGLTPTGRATARQLKLNRPWLMHARRRWIEVGWHPPADDA
jgi:5-methylcytosine-specific restriction endonuclease McrA